MNIPVYNAIHAIRHAKTQQELLEMGTFRFTYIAPVYEANDQGDFLITGYNAELEFYHTDLNRYFTVFGFFSRNNVDANISEVSLIEDIGQLQSTKEAL